MARVCGVGGNPSCFLDSKFPSLGYFLYRSQGRWSLELLELLVSLQIRHPGKEERVQQPSTPEWRKILSRAGSADTSLLMTSTDSATLTNYTGNWTSALAKKENQQGFNSATRGPDFRLFQSWFSYT